MTMDNVGVDPNEEDERCAEYIEGGLRGEELDFEMKSRMRAVPSGAKFFDPARPHFREDDINLAMELDRFGFILRVEAAEGPYIVKVDI